MLTGWPCRPLQRIVEVLRFLVAEGIELGVYQPDQPLARQEFARIRGSPNASHDGCCWRLRKLRLRDEDGVEFNIEPAFFSAVQGCVAR